MRIDELKKLEEDGSAKKIASRTFYCDCAAWSYDILWSSKGEYYLECVRFSVDNAPEDNIKSVEKITLQDTLRYMCSGMDDDYIWAFRKDYRFIRFCWKYKEAIRLMARNMAMEFDCLKLPFKEAAVFMYS